MKKISCLIIFCFLFIISTSYAAQAPSSAVSEKATTSGVLKSRAPTPVIIEEHPTAVAVPKDEKRRGALRKPEDKGYWSPHVLIGSGYGFAVDFDGELYSWGREALGKLGLGNPFVTYDEYNRPISINVKTPRKVKNLIDVTDISAAGTFMHGIQNGEIWSWGGNITNVPVKVTEFGGGWVKLAGSSGGVTYALKDDGTLWKFKDDKNDLERFGTHSDWISIDAYLGHVCGLREGVSRGIGGGAQVTLWCWGNNDHGEVGNGETGFVRDPYQVNLSEDIKSYAVGQYHTCAVTNSGVLYCWGRGDFHQLGQGGHPGSIGVGHLWPVIVGSGYDSVYAGRYHNCAIKEDDRLFCWGCNKYGQLGKNAMEVCRDSSYVNYDSCVCNSNVTLPTMVGSDNDWEFAFLGEYSTCALKKNGKLFCFGHNRYGSGLGIGDREADYEFTPVEVKKGLYPGMAIPGMLRD